MTQIVNTQLGNAVFNKLSFKPKSLGGHWRDFKALCAAAGRMDLFKRFEVLVRARGHGFGKCTLRRMASFMARGHADTVERYITIAEGGGFKDTRAGRAARLHCSRVGAQGQRVSTGVRASRNPHLEPPDPFADNG